MLSSLIACLVGRTSDSMNDGSDKDSSDEMVGA